MTEFELVSERALEDMSSAIHPFHDFPDKCELIVLTLRGLNGVMTLTEDGTTTPTLLGHGADYPLGTYQIFTNKSEATKIQAIGSGIVSGWIQFFKPLGR